MQTNDDKQIALSIEQKPAYESSEPSVHWIVFSAFAVVVMMGVSGAIIWAAMKGMSHTRPPDLSRMDRGIVVAPDLRLLKRFPPPNLQVAPKDDLQALRAREEAELHTYGWVDQSREIVRVPIDRAMELILHEGLPVATNSPAGSGKSSLELIRERTKQ